MCLLNKKNFIWNIIKKLGNLNFSIILLLILACVSIIGTIIEQDQNILFYQINYPIENDSFLNLNWKIIIFFGLDHIYMTLWFILLLTLFFCSLIVCTFSRQLPSLRNARNWKFLQQTKNLRKFADFKVFYYKSLSNIIYSLNHEKYYTFHKNKSLYAYKGLLGRIAPIFVHFSIILTLIGSLLGLFGGFMIQEMIPNGEIFHLKNSSKAGIYSYLPIDLIGRVDNFIIEYNKDNSIKQFFSSISLLNNKNKYIYSKQISVNSPLIFHGITFYQIDWQVNCLRLKIGNNFIVQQQLKKIELGNKVFWFANFPINSKQRLFLIVKNLNDNIFIYNSSGKLTNILNLNEEIIINNTSFMVKEIMTSTGLQIKTDPGIQIVYTGFFILILSIGISYLSYSQIWINSYANNLELAGSTSRAVLKFEEDFINIQKKYIIYTFINIYNKK
uniref:Cytochrome c biogenesis protein CcsB n=1 Tax=Plocamium cartilagineum TaxID=31452 RepID=A0A1C9CHW1_PLOCA|nr:c-type cytochrome biogenensis protein [Plocamium cartilagineum]AOM67942.1 c-type cytochrome biogenensis protein [Plocamium cartilagineum]